MRCLWEYVCDVCFSSVECGGSAEGVWGCACERGRGYMACYDMIWYGMYHFIRQRFNASLSCGLGGGMEK